MKDFDEIFLFLNGDQKEYLCLLYKEILRTLSSNPYEVVTNLNIMLVSISNPDIRRACYIRCEQLLKNRFPELANALTEQLLVLP